jgi:hypothetical protein
LRISLSIGAPEPTLKAVAIIQAVLALVGRSAGKILNAIFGWAVRALFGQTTTREQTFLSVVVGAAVAWPILLIGIVAPKIAALLLAFVPLPHWVPSWIVRLVWAGLALVIPIGVGIAVAAKAPPGLPKESIVKRVLRGFPITVALAGAFLIMFVSVPVMRLAALARRQKSADIPLTTDAAAYHDVARKLCEVLNRHGFSFQRGMPGWWVAAPTRILGALGGDAFRAYVPDRLEHFVSDDLEMSLYPSGLLLRGASRRLTWAQGLVAATVTHTAGLQTTDPKAQEVERRLRRLWNSYDAAGGQADTGALEKTLDQIASDLGELDVAFDDWQVLYRQILQVGRVIRGERQLLDAKAAAAGGKTDFADKTELSLSYPSDLWDPKLLPMSEGDLGPAERGEAATERSGAPKPRTGRALAFSGGALLPITAVLFLAHVIPGWAAGLLIGGFLAAIGAMMVLAAGSRHPNQPRAAGRA